MKKILTILSVVILSVIVALPFFGNKAVEKVLRDRIEVLNSFGLEIDNIKSDSTYLKSNRHYIVYVKDADKFITYLNQFSSPKIPIYLNNMVEGTILEVKIQYSNIPLTDGVSIDIYPLKLSENIIDNIKESDVELSRYISDFLYNKGFGYYLNYNILSKVFSGHIKDIEESHTLSSGYKIDVKLRGATFNGSGILLAPEKLNSKIDEIFFKVDGNSQKIDILFSDISESLVFKSKTNYSINSKIKHIALNVYAKDFNKSEIIFNNIDFDISTNTKNKKIDFFAKTTFDKLIVDTPKVIVDIDGFIYDMSLTKLDKDIFEQIIELANQAKIDQTLQEQMTEKIISLLLKGLELKIADFSLSKVTVNKSEDLGGVSLKVDVVFPPNVILANKQENINNISKNMNIDLLIKISKKMFIELSQAQPILVMTQSFAKEQNDNFIFNIKIDDGNLTVNDKVIQ